MDFPCTWWGQCKNVAWIIDSPRGQIPIPALWKSTADIHITGCCVDTSGFGPKEPCRKWEAGGATPVGWWRGALSPAPSFLTHPSCFPPSPHTDLWVWGQGYTSFSPALSSWLCCVELGTSLRAPCPPSHPFHPSWRGKPSAVRYWDGDGKLHDCVSLQGGQEESHTVNIYSFPLSCLTATAEQFKCSLKWFLCTRLWS